jgi:putative hemolysin
LTTGAWVWGILGVGVAGLFTAARTAILSANHQEFPADSRNTERWMFRAKALLDPPDRLLVTTRMASELSFLGAGTLVLTQTWGSWGLAAISLGVFFWTFHLLGELLPQALVAQRPTAWVPLMTWVISVGQWVVFPWALIVRLVKATGWGGSRAEDTGEPTHVSRQELAWLILGEGETQGLPQDERQMIHRIFRFSQTQVREVMIPLIEVRALEEGATAADVIRLVADEGYSRFPVYRERIDHILGVIRGFDFLEVADLDAPMAPFVRKAPFVPETMPVDELMLQLQREGNHMAIVVDEYGGSVGIVSLEDLLEEIVGEIEDEYDIQEVQYRRLSPHQLLVSARVEIDELNERLGLQIPKEDFETLGGFLLKGFGRIPKEGESLILRGTRFTVQKATERSVEEVMITLPKGEGAEARG